MTEVVCVGTSDAFGAGGRRQSAYLVQSASGNVLLDCGATTGSGLASVGVERDAVEAILVSHFHADHFGGIPLFLLASLYEDARKSPLRIVGPQGVEARVRALARALGHPMEQHRFGFPIHFEDLVPNREVEIGPVRVRAFGTRHSPDSRPHGLVVQTEDARVAYSGDTGWFSDLPVQVRGSDLFLCECTLTRRSFEYHLSLEELSEQRDEFDCGRFFLTHLGAAMRERSDYAGFEVADDGLVIKL